MNEEQEAIGIEGMKRWPGLLEAIQASVREIDEFVQQDTWEVARTKDPEHLKELMATHLKNQLAKLPPEVVLDIAAQGTTSIVVKILLEMAEKGKL